MLHRYLQYLLARERLPALIDRHYLHGREHALLALVLADDLELVGLLVEALFRAFPLLETVYVLPSPFQNTSVGSENARGGVASAV